MKRTMSGTTSLMLQQPPCSARKENDSLSYKVGDKVIIDPRTWPGINKLGGVGKITFINAQANSINVRYVLGGTEKDVSFSFVRKYNVDLEEARSSDTLRRPCRGTVRKHEYDQMLAGIYGNQPTSKRERKLSKNQSKNENNQTIRKSKRSPQKETIAYLADESPVAKEKRIKSSREVSKHSKRTINTADKENDSMCGKSSKSELLEQSATEHCDSSGDVPRQTKQTLNSAEKGKNISALGNTDPSEDNESTKDKSKQVKPKASTVVRRPVRNKTHDASGDNPQKLTLKASKFKTEKDDSVLGSSAECDRYDSLSAVPKRLTQTLIKAIGKSSVQNERNEFSGDDTIPVEQPVSSVGIGSADNSSGNRTTSERNKSNKRKQTNNDHTSSKHLFKNQETNENSDKSTKTEVTSVKSIKKRYVEVKEQDKDLKRRQFKHNATISRKFASSEDSGFAQQPSTNFTSIWKNAHDFTSNVLGGCDTSLESSNSPTPQEKFKNLTATTVNNKKGLVGSDTKIFSSVKNNRGNTKSHEPDPRENASDCSKEPLSNISAENEVYNTHQENVTSEDMASTVSYQEFVSHLLCYMSAGDEQAELAEFLKYMQDRKCPFQKEEALAIVDVLCKANRIMFVDGIIYRI